MMSISRYTTIFASFLLCASCARAQAPETKLKILINPGPVFSHWLPVLKICRELEQSHQLKYLYPADLEDLADKFNLPAASRIPHAYSVKAAELVTGVADLKAQGREQEVAKLMIPYFLAYARAAVEDNSSMAIIKNWAPDVLFYEAGFPSGAPIGTLLKIPTVGFHVLGHYGSFYLQQAGSPSAVSLIPTFPVPVWINDPMTIIDRAKCLFSGVIGMLIARAIDQAFTPMWTENGMPHLTHSQGMGTTAAWIFQSDFAFLQAVPLSPHVHVLGSFTAEPAQPLQGALRAFCDAHMDTGVIYISSGSSALAVIGWLAGIHEAVSGLGKMPVVWKLNPSDQAMLQQHNLSIPANVHVVEYAPQNDLLGHPALRAFVTQGGSNSALEGLFHGVPMIIIPLYVEQPLNANRIENLGAGIALRIASPINAKELAQQLSSAFEKVSASNSYADNAQHISKLMRAQRWTPVQKAASVIEAVAWTGGSTHTHMLRHGQSIIARHNLDLYLILACAATAAILLLVYLARKAYKAIRALRNQSDFHKHSKQA